jgi:hypothetical protein
MHFNPSAFKGGEQERGLSVNRYSFLAAIAVAGMASSGAAAAEFSKDGLPAGLVDNKTCNPYVDYNCTGPKAAPYLAKAAAMAKGGCDPYVNYSCLDAYLGDNPAVRFVRYYQLEWGKATAPADPKAPPGSRPESLAPPTPQSTPPMPFTEWPYGGTQNIGKTLPNAVDSPLMVAIANTSLGKAMNDAHVQVYGWVAPGGNLSTNTVKPAGNFPVSYDYTPNTVQLDQAVVYIERVPDEVQNDHFDWGFRLSSIYGVDYRYTTAYGLFSYQLLNHNQANGFDFPMLYTDLYFPILQGLNVRIGRFISIPDIEAQLAPNNYTYVHSLTYTFDNYTNTGIQLTQALTKNWILQAGVAVGTDTVPWHWGATRTNPVPNALYGSTMPVDPGAKPSGTLGVRWTSDDGRDDLNVVADAINNGVWGYNNLQWYGFTYYHKLSDYWHFAFESWNIHESNVPNANNAQVMGWYNAGGTPFSPQYTPFNAPNLAQCSNAAVLTCSADEQTFLLYLNYSPNKLNNFSLRTEFFMDPQGQRTGVATNYADVAFGWQHWFSPQIEIRPEVGYYRSLNALAFNGNAAAGIVPSRNWAVIAASDIIIHF